MFLHTNNIGRPKKVPVSHKVQLVQKRALYLDTAQQEKLLSRNFLRDVFGGHPIVSSCPTKKVT